MIKLGLCAQFAAKVFGWIGSRTANGFGYFSHIYNDSLDTIPFALNLGGNAGHFIAIEYVGDITINIDRSHFDWKISELITIQIDLIPQGYMCYDDSNKKLRTKK